jgi:hypothetical protein
MDSVSSSTKEIGDLDIRSISFCCGGWLEFYLFGVAKAIAEYNLHKNIPLLGCSAGALTAAGLACEGNFDDSIDYCKQIMIPDLYSTWGGPFQLHKYVSECLDACANLEAWHTLPPGRLQIAYTALPSFKKERATSYSSREDLKQCLLASAAAFPFSKLTYHRGCWNGDGGFTDLQPIIDEHTITVSPFYFMNTDIKPSRYVPLWWALFPPNSPDAVDWVYELGYNDAINWIHERSEHQLKKGNTKSVARGRSDSLRNSHPFDIPRQISVHRFLGFDVADLTHSSVSMFMDFCLYLLLLCVWKPIAITMIYMELFVKVILLISASVLYELYDLLPMLFVGYSLLAPHTTLLLWMYTFTGVVKLAVVGPASGSHIGDLWDCVRCIGSASLLRRYIPTSLSKLSADPLKKHVPLNKSSLVYRVVRHFV